MATIIILKKVSKQPNGNITNIAYGTHVDDIIKIYGQPSADSTEGEIRTIIYKQFMSFKWKTYVQTEIYIKDSLVYEVKRFQGGRGYAYRIDDNNDTTES